MLSQDEEVTFTASLESCLRLPELLLAKRFTDSAEALSRQLPQVKSLTRFHKPELEFFPVKLVCPHSLRWGTPHNMNRFMSNH